MSLPSRSLVLAVLALGLASSAMAQNAPSEEGFSVWARMLFGHDGKPREAQLLDEARYPPTFAAKIKQRLMHLEVPPPVLDGNPATLQSAAEVRVVISPAPEGEVARIIAINLGPYPKPRPIEPRLIAALTGGWEGAIEARCTVSPAGRCREIEVGTPPGALEPARRYVKAAMQRMRFDPVLLDGKPVASEFRKRFVVDTSESSGPEDFREPKFDRLYRLRMAPAP